MADVTDSTYRLGNHLYFDLTHPTTMFEPLDGDATQADI